MKKNLNFGALKDLKSICAMALCVAVYVALYMLQIPITPQLRITFTFIPLAISGWLFGAIPALVVGLLCDLVSFVVFPTGAYFFGFTLTAMLSGFIYGLFMYKKDGKSLFWNTVIAKTLVTFLLNIGLNSLWLSMLYEKAFIVYLLGRVLKNVILLPIEIAILYAIILLLIRAGVQKMYK